MSFIYVYDEGRGIVIYMDILAISRKYQCQYSIQYIHTCYPAFVLRFG